MTITEYTESIKRYERDLAPGSESALWGAYAEDVRRQTSILPWDDAADETDCPPSVMEWWTRAYEIAASDPTMDLGAIAQRVG